MKVAIYLRKSRDEENETREFTLARHETILREYCEKHDLFYTEDDIYREVVSGENVASRPQMQLLLEEVKNLKYDGVVCIELERLSRGSGADQEHIKNVFKESNTLIYTLNKIYDLANENAMDEDFFEFGLFMSRREYTMIKKRLQRGRQQARKEGYFVTGTPSYGYTKEKQGKGYVLVPHPVEADVLKTIFRMYASDEYGNKELSAIRDYLHGNKIKTKTGNDIWTAKRLRMILQNKTYIGFCGTDYVREVATNWIPGKHDPLIDMDTWNKVQQKIQDRKTHLPSSSELTNPLATILKCSFCGYTMQNRCTRKDGKGRRLNCPTKGCQNVLAYVEDIEKKLMQELEKELEGFNHFLENKEDEILKLKKQNEVDIKLVEEQINKKKNAIDRCCEAFEDGIYSKEKYLTRVNVLEQDLVDLKSNLKVLKEKDFSEVDSVKNKIPIIEKVLKEYWNLSPQEKNDLLKSFIDKILYTKTFRNNAKGVNLKEDAISLEIFLKI